MMSSSTSSPSLMSFICSFLLRGLPSPPKSPGKTPGITPGWEIGPAGAAAGEAGAAEPPAAGVEGEDAVAGVVMSQKPSRRHAPFSSVGRDTDAAQPQRGGVTDNTGKRR